MFTVVMKTASLCYVSSIGCTLSNISQCEFYFFVLVMYHLYVN